MRVNLRSVVVVLAFLLAAPAWAQAQPKAVPSAGVPQDIPGASELPDPALQYRILFDVSKPNRDPAQPHQTFARAASMLNAMAASGVKPPAGAIAIVVHGAPDSNLLTDAAHMKRFGKPNPAAGCWKSWLLPASRSVFAASPIWRTVMHAMICIRQCRWI